MQEGRRPKDSVIGYRLSVVGYRVSGIGGRLSVVVLGKFRQGLIRELVLCKKELKTENIEFFIPVFLTSGYNINARTKGTIRLGIRHSSKQGFIFIFIRLTERISWVQTRSGSLIIIGGKRVLDSRFHKIFHLCNFFE